MNTTNNFSTHTDQRWYIGFVAASFLLVGIAGFVGMWIWIKMIGPALMVAGCALLGLVFMVLILKSQPNAQLHFEGDELKIHHIDRNNYEVCAVPASDFICRQSKFEKKYNVGRISVKGTIFHFYGVQNYAETCNYIRENFPHY